MASEAAVRDLFRMYFEYEGIQPDIDEDGDFAWEYGLSADNPSSATPCLATVEVVEKAQGMVRVEHSIAIVANIPNEKYWDTLDLVNRVNGDMQSGMAFVVWPDQLMVALKTGLTSDLVSQRTVQIVCAVAGIHAKTMLPLLLAMWRGEVSAIAAAAAFWNE